MQVTIRVVLSLTIVGLVGFAALSMGAGLNFDSPDERINKKKLNEALQVLRPLHQTMGPVQPGDWLASHREDGQSFAQYLKSRPVKLTKKRQTIYVLPLGDFDPKQQKIVELSTEYLGLYFGCKTKSLPALSLDDTIPAHARRVHPQWGVRQIKSTFVLDEVLPDRLPEDGAALIALTSSDLYPADDWNFVFGQASLRNRVGVWSIYRNGDASTEFQRCLRRTLQTATHETGHMFSMAHCTAYECNMCGSNNRAESDRRPLYLCPECMAKVCWATKDSPLKRIQRLLKFCRKHQLDSTAKYFERAQSALINAANSNP